MQNRDNRSRGYDDNQYGGWRDDDVTWDAQDRSRDEGRSWSGGADREFRRTEGYGPPSRSSRSDPGRDRSSSDPYGSRPYETTRSYGGGRSDWDRNDGRYAPTSRSGEFGEDYGYGRAYGQGSNARYGQDRRPYGVDASRDYRDGRYGGNDQDRGYAPGSQIWGDHGRAPTNRSDYEPDYLHWRDQQMSKFDRDYDDWRSEKRQKFSSDFDTWRTTRNTQVENVSDGGTGSQKDIKTS